MPASKRRAQPRTAAAVAEDLRAARAVGGLARAGNSELAATLDWLQYVGEVGEPPVDRARDLLLHYVTRVCDAAQVESEPIDRTAIAAGGSLRRLLLRPASDDLLAETVRRESTHDAEHTVSTDAVRHREDRLIVAIADEVAADLGGRGDGVPRTVEAAVHALAPIAIDLRQQLHDGLCLIYGGFEPADPEEARAIEGFLQITVVDLGRLLVRATQLEEVGLSQAHRSRVEMTLVNLGRWLAGLLFNEADDRQRMLSFTLANADSSAAEASEQLRSTPELGPLYERWLRWVRSCYATCAFERATDTNYMCSPHAFLTLLYDFEVAYLRFGYSLPVIDENEPVRHHTLGRSDRP